MYKLFWSKSAGSMAPEVLLEARPAAAKVWAEDRED